MYKHKKTGDVAEITSKGVYSSKDKNNFCYHLPASIVENSCDWIKVEKKKPVLVTKDGVELFLGDSYYFIWTNRPAHGQVEFTPYHVKVLTDKGEFCENAIFFSTKDAANKWMLDLKNSLEKKLCKEEVLDLKQIKELQSMECLSINDVAEVFVTANRFRNRGSEEPLYDLDKQGRELIQIVQNKFKQRQENWRKNF